MATVALAAAAAAAAACSGTTAPPKSVEMNSMFHTKTHTAEKSAALDTEQTEPASSPVTRLTGGSTFRTARTLNGGAMALELTLR